MKHDEGDLMTDKMNNLATWLATRGLPVESSLVSDIRQKLAQSTPSELRSLFTPDQLGPDGATPDSPESLRKLFTPDQLGPDGATPDSPESLRKLFTPDQLGGAGLAPDEQLEDDILFKGKVLKKGARDITSEGIIKKVQSLLKNYGHAVDPDGHFGEVTERSILEFQKNNKHRGLSESGELDAATLLVLRSPAAKRKAPPAEALSTGLKPSGEIPPSIKPVAAGTHVLPKVSFVSVPCSSCAALAQKEAKEKWDNGNISEKDPRAEETITKYYDYTSKNNSWKNNIDRWGTGRRTDEKHKGKKQMNPVKERNEDGVATNWWHWSAVYVTWVMKQYDGEGATWYANEGHTLYIAAAKRKRRIIEQNPSDHIGKMYYVWFTKAEMDKYGMKPELGDVIGRGSHCDIYIGGNMLIGGNTTAKNESTGNNKKYDGGTSGPKPLRWKSGFGIIKRVRVTGPGSNSMVA
jgi:peptidoglycan hydrolase-like protein with peptidoglycan-binding domain